MPKVPKEYECILPERAAIVELWELIKKYHNVGTKTGEAKVNEWREIIDGAKAVFDMGETPAQKKLAQALAAAAMDYFIQLDKQEKGD